MGGGGGILVGGWGGINFQGLQKFHSNIGRNACLTYRYLISNFFSWFVEEWYMHTHVGSTKTANSSESTNL